MIDENESARSDQDSVQHEAHSSERDYDAAFEGVDLRLEQELGLLRARYVRLEEDEIALRVERQLTDEIGLDDNGTDY